jgi:DNA repair protein RadA/Sms
MAEMNLNVKRGFKMGTMVQSIKVPPELRVKHSVGIDWVNDVLGGEGGVTASSVVMLTGGPGCGKSTLIRQLANAMSQTDSTLLPFYNCGEESLFQARLAMERLNCANDFMVGEETDLPKLLTYLDNVRKANPKKVVTLLQDSLQTLNDMKYKDGGTTGNTPVRCTELLVDWAQRREGNSNFGHIWFVGQVTKGGDFAGKNTIKHAIDVHMHLFYDEDKKSDTYGCLLGEVQKNRWGCNGKTYILGMTKTGIEERGSFTKGKDFKVGEDAEEDE